MRLKLYRAATVPLAMARVRAELGEDALILATRRVADGVEVTAALEPEESGAPPLKIMRADGATLAALTWHGVPATMLSRLQSAPLAAALAATLHFAPLALAPGAPPLLFAGPPGAGKTLTVARLATRMVLEGGSPLVITADARRAGAVEQLAALTRLLGLGLVVADNPVAVVRAVARRPSGTVVLLDLPGTDVFDETEQEDLATLTSTLGATTVAVLPAGLDAAEATDLATAYRAAGTTRLVATRLDCTRRLGSVLAAAEAGLALAEFGVGPGAADGLVAAGPELLAEWLTRKSAPGSPGPSRDAERIAYPGPPQRLHPDRMS
jgi:flagellar biosynthesis protein FlhF